MDMLITIANLAAAVLNLITAIVLLRSANKK